MRRSPVSAIPKSANLRLDEPALKQSISWAMAAFRRAVAAENARPPGRFKASRSQAGRPAGRHLSCVNPCRGGEMPRHPIIAALLLAASMLAPAPAGAAECAGTGAPIERAMCGEPRLAAAQAAMQVGYTLLRARLPAERRAALRLDQQLWLRARAASCGDKKDGPLVHCLLDETEARGHMLAGEGRNGAADGVTLEPAFFREARKGAWEIEIAYPQLRGAGGAAAAFNAAARDFILADGKLMAQFRTAAAGASLA